MGLVLQLAFELPRANICHHSPCLVLLIVTCFQ